MTRNQFYRGNVEQTRQAWNSPTKFDVSRLWGSQDNANRQAWGRQEITEDEMLIEIQRQKNEMARKARTRGELANAQEQLALLKSFASNPSPNLYRAPVDDREAALQRIVQEDYNKRDVGFRVGYNSEIVNENAYNKRLDTALGQAAAYQGLQRGEQQIAGGDVELEKAIRSLEANFEQQRIDNAAAERERKTLKDQKYFESKDAETEARIRSGDYEEALQNIQMGMPPEVVARIFPSLKKEQKDRLANYVYLQKREVENANSAAALYNNLLTSKFASIKTKTPEKTQTAFNEVLDRLNKDQSGRDMITWDEKMRQFIPIKRATPSYNPVVNRAMNNDATQGTQQNPIQVRSIQEAMRVPSGKWIRTPDGRSAPKP